MRARLLLPVLVALLSACASPRAAVTPIAAVLGAEESGLASWYGHPYHGRRTASGEVYNMYRLTAAHPSLPFGTWVHVENLDNRRDVHLRVNDRGPFVDGRVIDVSYAAAVALDAVRPGVVPVRLHVIALPGGSAPPALGSPPGPGGPGPGPVGARFSVQLGAFAEAARAAIVQRALAAEGMEAVVEPASSDRGLYRVRSGSFATRAEAIVHAGRLATLGYAPIVVGE